jgi:MYXO-CTERM domain-containing protein
MAWMRWTWALGLAVVGTMTAPCAWAADAGSDAGTDAGDDGGDAGLVCPAPAPIAASFTPPAYVHAAPHQNACSQQLIADYYTQCLGSAATAQTCAPWTNAPDAAHQACVACLVTPATASAYGPVVQTTFGNIIVSESNLAGCIELADPAGLACATALQDRTDCDEAACTTQCPIVDDASFLQWQTCENNADNAASSCGAYFQATSCAASEMPDGGVAAACFPAAANPTFEDDYGAIAPVFCLDLTAGADAGPVDGGGGADAGGGGDGGSTGGDGGSTGGDGGSTGGDGGIADGGGASDGGFMPVDGGPVTTPVDAGGGSDGGGGSDSSKASSGCSCRTAPASEGASALLALAGVVFLARARRRKR